MKKTIAILLASAGLVTGALAYANHPGEDGKHGEMRLQHMKEELNLTADQEAKIRAIFQKQQEKMKAIHEQTRDSIAAVLTADQKAKFERKQEERQEKIHERNQPDPVR
jgi:Spy/CpxP family protein refolding chaperone